MRTKLKTVSKEDFVMLNKKTCISFCVIITMLILTSCRPMLPNNREIGNNSQTTEISPDKPIAVKVLIQPELELWNDTDKNHGFSEGVAIVKNKDGKSGAIDKTGKTVIPFEFVEISDFSEGMALACKGEGEGTEDYREYCFIDKTGKTVIKLDDYTTKNDYSGYTCNVSKFSEGLACVEKDSLSGYIDKTGQVVIPLEYETGNFFQEGLATVRKDGKFGFIDMKGKVIIPFEYDSAMGFSEGLAIVSKSEYFGNAIIDKGNKILVPWGQYEIVGSCSDGLFKAKELNGSKYGFIDKTGKIIAPFEYDMATDFNEGLACVGIKNDTNSAGVINKSGEIVVPLQYDNLHQYSNGLIRFFSADQVMEDIMFGKSGFIDKNGTVVVPPEYDSATDFNEGLAIIEKNIPTFDSVVSSEYSSATDFDEGLEIIEKIFPNMGRARNNRLGILAIE